VVTEGRLVEFMAQLIAKRILAREAAAGGEHGAPDEVRPSDVASGDASSASSKQRGGGGTPPA